MHTKLSLTEYYRNALKAPRANQFWSWGAENAENVYLTCWTDESIVVDGKRLYLVYDPSKAIDHAGAKERLRHIDAIRAGKPSWVVRAVPKSRETKPIEIQDLFRNLRKGIALIEIDGKTYLEAGEEVDPFKESH